jgi:hypothetical protein
VILAKVPSALAVSAALSAVDTADTKCVAGKWVAKFERVKCSRYLKDSSTAAAKKAACGNVYESEISSLGPPL